MQGFQPVAPGRMHGPEQLAIGTGIPALCIRRDGHARHAGHRQSDEEVVWGLINTGEPGSGRSRDCGRRDLFEFADLRLLPAREFIMKHHERAAQAQQIEQTASGQRHRAMRLQQRSNPGRRATHQDTHIGNKG